MSVHDLISWLDANESEIRHVLKTSDGQWKQMLRKRLAKLASSPDDHRHDEKVWTFLVATGYAAEGPGGAASLRDALIEDAPADSGTPSIWFEALPMSPRMRERNTNVDLAIGSIEHRIGAAGIGLARSSTTWVCMCEMKWGSDISTTVTNDPHRNQLARVIENAVCFQGHDALVDLPIVRLVTPAAFADPSKQSRLYHYKLAEYRASAEEIARDLEASVLSRRHQPGAWEYPGDVRDRLDALDLDQVTYESLYERIPPSSGRDRILKVWTDHGVGQFGR